MTVSIITSTFNSENFINLTLQSIISQTYPSWELLITDDCSTDNTVHLIQSIAARDQRIKLFRLDKNFGAAVARNNSLIHAKGRYIAFCDSDDLWHPEKLQKQIEFMTENELVLSYTNYVLINENGENIGFVSSPKEIAYKSILRNNYIGCSTAMYDSSKIGKIPMPNLRKRQDWALWLSILKHIPLAKGIQENLVYYRICENSMSSSKFNLIKYNWRIYREHEKFSFGKSILYFVQFLYFYFLKKIF